jgi:hypothetical protein
MDENGHTYLIVEDLDGDLGSVEKPFADAHEFLLSLGFVRRRDQDQQLASNGLVRPTHVPHP